jgi:hypothetical protein
VPEANPPKPSASNHSASLLIGRDISPFGNYEFLILNFKFRKFQSVFRIEIDNNS